MARQRIIKPDFFTDEDLARCSPHARLLFSGLWTLADKRGRMKDQPPVIHGAIFPYEPGLNVDGLLGELAAGGFIDRYEVDGKRYLSIPKFETHQRPHPKEIESLIPACPQGNGTAAKVHGSAVERNGPAGRFLSVPSVPSKPSDVGRSECIPVPGSNGNEPPALPPADAAERSIRQKTDALRTKLYALVTEAERLDPKKRDPTELIRLFTSYRNRDGKDVGGVVNAGLLTHERLERSIADAEEQIEDWRHGKRSA
jgi:hypothetical protein